MNNLSIINEVVLEQGMKGRNETMERSGDSGLASSESSNSQSGNNDSNNTNGCLIIQFKALNASEENVRESTFVTNRDIRQESCDLSGIANANGAKTINSDDGKN